MLRDTDTRHDLAAAIVSLAAEAALLEARVKVLREELSSVNDRIRTVSEELNRRLVLPPTAGSGRHNRT
ncbi:hypothetical protein [Streptomyces sp. NPDC086010]|uniref:hypothetical protein n=1 Tax=Streptomyces sp. NPDC086010 TaxID=3365745 RepID=UPI0037D8963A